jgi:hypothetical protein
VADAGFQQFEVSKVGQQTPKMDAGIKKYLRGMVGCSRAHLRELEAAKAEGQNSLLNVEDEMGFDQYWLEQFQLAFSEVPEGWMQLYLSAKDFRPSSPVSAFFWRLAGA